MRKGRPEGPNSLTITTVGGPGVSPRHPKHRNRRSLNSKMRSRVRLRANSTAGNECSGSPLQNDAPFEMRSIRRRCGFDGFSSDVVEKVVVLLWKMGGGRKKGRGNGRFWGDVAMDAIFWAGENHQLRDFYLARMRQGERIRGNEARVRRRADGGERGGRAERGREGRGTGMDASAANHESEPSFEL